MQVTLKTLEQQSFKIDIDPEKMVKALKEKTGSEKGKDAFQVAGQKVIYAGKILNAAAALKEHKIDENNFLVVMVAKPKAVTPPSPAATQPSSPAAPPPFIAPQQQLWLRQQPLPLLWLQLPHLCPSLQQLQGHLLSLCLLVQLSRRSQQRRRPPAAPHHLTMHQEALSGRAFFKIPQVHLWQVSPRRIWN